MKKDSNILKYMYRYLEKYIGKYRVLACYDIDTNDFPRDHKGNIDESFDDLYIPCKKGVIKHTYDDYDNLVLCFYDKRASVAQSIYDEICNKYKDIDVNLVLDGNDNYIYFYDKDISKIASIVKPKTSGARIKWNDPRNLPKIKCEIPETESKKLSKLIGDVPKNRKMAFVKSCNSSFLESISNSKINHKLEMKKSRLSAKEYIYKIGLWDKYLKYIKQKVKEL